MVRPEDLELALFLGRRDRGMFGQAGIHALSARERNGNNPYPPPPPQVAAPTPFTKETERGKSAGASNPAARNITPIIGVRVPRRGSKGVGRRVSSEERERRFWDRVRLADSGCWQWVGSIDPLGYGFHSSDRGPVRAHTYAYRLLIGEVPTGLELDHLCRNRSCVNPLHLEPVTRRENVLRGNSPMARALRTNRCIHGHEFTPENTYVAPKTGLRQCKECARIRAATYRERETQPRDPRFCKRGHRFNEANTYTTPKGFRECRICRRMRLAAHAERRREGEA